MDQDKQKKLEGYLSNLSEDEVHKLTSAVELNRLKGEKDPSQDFILDSLRPVFANSLSLPPRLMTPMRLFCLPFEDMLYPIDVEVKEAGRIMRSSLTPIWEWLSMDLLPGVFTKCEDEVKRAILNGDRESADHAVKDLQGKAADAMKGALDKALKGTSSYLDLAERLGGEIVVEDARDISLALQIAPQLQAMVQCFPQPILSMTEADIQQVHACYSVTVSQNKMDSVPMIFLAVMGRLQHPWKVLGVIRAVTGLNADDVFHHRTNGDAGRLLMNDVNKFTTYFEKLKQMQIEPHDVLENLSYFVQLVDGIVEESGLTEDSEYGEALLACRGRVADGMEEVLDRIPTIMRAAIPSKSSGGFGKKAIARPDTTRWPNPDNVELAIDQAILLDGTGQLANQANFCTRRSQMIEELTELLDQYGEKICDEIHAAEGEDRERAEAHAETAVLLTHYIVGEDAADLLRRRVKSASAA